MRIRINTGRFTLPIYLPNWLVFNRWVIGMAIRGSAGAVPPEAMEKLFWELRKLTCRREPWELVHVESKDGESVSITL